VIEKLQKLSSQARRAVLGATIFFAVVAVLVMINTIRIAVYTHRDEVSIMKLVGASNAFVRGPFLGEAVIYSFLGAGVTLILTYFFAAASAPYVSGLFGQSNFNLMSYWQAHVGRIFFGELAATVVVSVLATIFALRRYLKV
jgi:cell division transport system permease protein